MVKVFVKVKVIVKFKVIAKDIWKSLSFSTSFSKLFQDHYSPTVPETFYILYLLTRIFCPDNKVWSCHLLGTDLVDFFVKSAAEMKNLNNAKKN